MSKIKRNESICEKCGKLRYAKKRNDIRFASYGSNSYGSWEDCRPRDAEIIVCGYTGMILWIKEKGFKISKDAMKDCKMRLEQIVNQ